MEKLLSLKGMRGKITQQHLCSKNGRDKVGFAGRFWGDRRPATPTTPWGGGGGGGGQLQIIENMVSSVTSTSFKVRVQI